MTVAEKKRQQKEHHLFVLVELKQDFPSPSQYIKRTYSSFAFGLNFIGSIFRKSDSHPFCSRTLKISHQKYTVTLSLSLSLAFFLYIRSLFLSFSYSSSFSLTRYLFIYLFTFSFIFLYFFCFLPWLPTRQNLTATSGLSVAFPFYISLVFFRTLFNK